MSNEIVAKFLNYIKRKGYIPTNLNPKRIEDIDEISIFDTANKGFLKLIKHDEIHCYFKNSKGELIVSRHENTLNFLEYIQPNLTIKKTFYPDGEVNNIIFYELEGVDFPVFEISVGVERNYLSNVHYKLVSIHFLEGDIYKNQTREVFIFHDNFKSVLCEIVNHDENNEELRFIDERTSESYINEFKKYIDKSSTLKKIPNLESALESILNDAKEDIESAITYISESKDKEVTLFNEEIELLKEQIGEMEDFMNPQPHPQKVKKRNNN